MSPDYLLSRRSGRIKPHGFPTVVIRTWRDPSPRPVPLDDPIARLPFRGAA